MFKDKCAMRIPIVCYSFINNEREAEGKERGRKRKREEKRRERKRESERKDIIHIFEILQFPIKLTRDDGFQKRWRKIKGGTEKQRTFAENISTRNVRVRYPFHLAN